MDELVDVLNMTNTVNFNAPDPGFVLLAEKYLPYYTYVTLPLATGIMLYLSIIVSIRIFARKDC